VSRGETIAYMGKSGNARGYHLHLELIDLREHWNLEESLEDFIKKIAQGESLTVSECGQLNKLLFSKKCKTDPLQSISGLAFAKRVNGKWVATEPAIPQKTHVQATKSK
jgi:murein DD-endopeptidase MepM/ murein hydrolase activator NlpD